tara:strand:- start:200 stop:421 length:222 start_codon:yes stop_codon:yes gene_type:complete
MRINTAHSSYKNLKKELNATTKDQLIINLLDKYRRLQAITDSCGFCSDNVIKTADVALEDVKHTCEEINNANS